MSDSVSRDFLLRSILLPECFFLCHDTLPPIGVCVPDSVSCVNLRNLVVQLLTVAVSHLHAIHCLSLGLHTPNLYLRFATPTIIVFVVAQIDYLYMNRPYFLTLQTLSY